jgi:hypothetical protein
MNQDEEPIFTETVLLESSQYDIVDCVEEQVEADPSKPGPKPKKLIAVEVFGYQVGRGLKRRVVTPDEIYKLAAIGSSDREIARWFDIAEDTLRRNFAGIIAKGREEMKMTLRRKQIQVALSGNAVMLIWLGKVLLGQQENAPTDDNKPLPWSDD